MAVNVKLTKYYAHAYKCAILILLLKEVGLSKVIVGVRTLSPLKLIGSKNFCQQYALAYRSITSTFDSQSEEDTQDETYHS